MPGKVFFYVSMSLDGFVAPEKRMDVELWPKLTGWEMTDPDVQLWMSKWTELQQWMFPQRFIRENLGLGQDGEEGRDNDILRRRSSEPARPCWESACSTSARDRGRPMRRTTRRSSS